MPSGVAEVLRIVYEDEWIVVIDKPHGLPTQASRGSTDSVFERLRAQYPYVALHHRLDTPASGLIVFALQRRANAGLAAAFREHLARRRYLAILSGLCPESRWRWERPVAERPARTDGLCLGKGEGCTAVQLSTHTGRRHQLRIHAARACTPICGDRRHGGEAGRRWPRLALHAHALSLPHPVTRELLSLSSPLPDDLIALWRAVGGPTDPGDERGMHRRG